MPRATAEGVQGGVAASGVADRGVAPGELAAAGDTAGDGGAGGVRQRGVTG